MIIKVIFMRQLKQNPHTPKGRRIQYSLMDMKDMGLNMGRKVNLTKKPKIPIYKRDMHAVWKPKMKKIVRAKANEFLLHLNPKQSYLFKVLLIQIRKNPKMNREEMNSLVMRTIKNQKGKEVENTYSIYAADAMFKKAIAFGAITAEKE